MAFIAPKQAGRNGEAVTGIIIGERKKWLTETSFQDENSAEIKVLRKGKKYSSEMRNAGSDLEIITEIKHY